MDFRTIEQLKVLTHIYPKEVYEYDFIQSDLWQLYEDLSNFNIDSST